MTFLRTNSGLNNLHLFLAVDAVVYLEGGESLPKEEIENGKFNDASDDIRFWQSVFNIFCPEKRCEFRSIGSKEGVKNIAEKIINGHVENVIVAMDRDFDNINNKILKNKNIVYTYGYSWENDVWSSDVLINAYCSITGLCKTKINECSKLIVDYYKYCSEKLQIPVKIDAILSQHSLSLFCRDSYKRYIEYDKVSGPKVNKVEIRKSIKTAREKLGKPIKSPIATHIVFFIDCFGHLFAEFAYTFLRYILSKKGFSSIPRDYANSIIVDNFSQMLAGDLLPVIKNHYTSEFSRIAH